MAVLWIVVSLSSLALSLALVAPSKPIFPSWPETRAFSKTSSHFSEGLSSQRLQPRNLPIPEATSSTAKVRFERSEILPQGKPPLRFAMLAMTIPSQASAFVVERTHSASLELAASDDKRFLYTAIYAAAHSLIAIPFFLFWEVDAKTKAKGAAVALPILSVWIALLGGWIPLGK